MSVSNKYKFCVSPDGLSQAETYAAAGYSNSLLAAALGISTDSLSRYYGKSAAFAEAIKKGRETYRQRRILEAENALNDRIHGKIITEREYMTDENGEIMPPIKVKERYIPPSDTAIIFALKKLKPDVYGDKANAGDSDEAVQIWENEIVEAINARKNKGSETEREIDPISAALYKLEAQAKSGNFEDEDVKKES